jgi:serine/threonine protein kinase
MPPSVESICNAMARNRLLSAEDIRSLRQRWLREAGPAGADVSLFGKWLVTNQRVTDYQAAVLLGRRQDPLRLGEYKIVSRVVNGRMAGVYKAVHTQGQTVAIKILPPARAADPKLLARFQRETRLAVKLQHPNVVRTFQTGADNGMLYLVMEYLEGSTLAEVLHLRGRLPTTEAIRLVYQALGGLQHIFEVGLVHRDLEPDNLMLAVSGSPDLAESTLRRTLKILDIGLGRALFDEGAPGLAGPVDITTEGDVLGMPEYRSPEQALDPHKADIRSDIYSLGCILYHALVGDPPFIDKNLVNLMLKHATQAPSPLSSFNLNAPPALQGVLDRMLAKDPALRYPTPSLAARDLYPFLAP